MVSSNSRIRASRFGMSKIPPKVGDTGPDLGEPFQQIGGHAWFRT